VTPLIRKRSSAWLQVAYSVSFVPVSGL